MAEEQHAPRLTARQVADYFLSLQDEESGDLISNLKLQKLMYYAQGFALASLGRPLFDADIKAWQHGPVVQDLYFAFNHHGSAAIPAPTNLDLKLFNDEERELLNEVHQVYGQFSAWKLRNMTHEEAPWMSTQKDQVITHDRLRQYFLTQLN